MALCGNQKGESYQRFRAGISGYLAYPDKCVAGEIYMKHSKPFSGYIVAAIALLFFSYTQVDLNLTLSRASLVQTIQKGFQFVGFYQRPLSTLIYVSILFSLFGLYAGLLHYVKKGEITLAAIWRLIIAVTVILVFS